VATRLLGIGDVHLGRRPTGLTPAASESVGGPRSVGPDRALARAVQEAIDRRVDAVLFAGDVVDDERDFYEAYTALEREVRRLAEAGIPVLGVAGNHDVEVLPRLARAIEAFRLVGKGGRWEVVTVAGREGPAVRILGWSFSGPIERASPFDRPLPSLAGEEPVIGLVHGERDASRSRHAPFRASDLRDRPADAWLLGHIHKPDSLDGIRPIGYLGTLSPLDPSETGPHGPWLLEVEGREAVRATHLPLAPLRYEEIDLDVTGAPDVDEVEARLVRLPDAVRDTLLAEGAPASAVGLRVRLVGTSPLRSALSAAQTRAHDLAVQRDDAVFFVQKIRSEVGPAVDLAALAEGRTDPAALLARRILLLDRGAEDPERRRFLEALRTRLATVARKPVYAALEPQDDALSEYWLASIAREAGLRALGDLLATREEGP